MRIPAAINIRFRRKGGGNTAPVWMRGCCGEDPVLLYGPADVFVVWTLSVAATGVNKVAG